MVDLFLYKTTVFPYQRKKKKSNTDKKSDGSISHESCIVTHSSHTRCTNRTNVGVAIYAQTYTHTYKYVKGASQVAILHPYTHIYVYTWMLSHICICACVSGRANYVDTSR